MLMSVLVFCCHVYAYDHHVLIEFYSVNAQPLLDVPSFVFVGARGHGKSALIEAMLGVPVNLVGQCIVHAQFQYTRGYVHVPPASITQTTFRSTHRGLVFAWF